jgi:hypothetical protein
MTATARLLALPLMPLTLVMGCPCCGPRWYARLHVTWYKHAGLPLPPELRGWQ